MSPAATGLAPVIHRDDLGFDAPGDIRLNYYMTGSTWTKGGLPPSGSNFAGTTPDREHDRWKPMFSHRTASTVTPRRTGSPVSTSDVSHMFPDLKPCLDRRNGRHPIR